MSRLLPALVLAAITSTLAGCGTKSGAAADSSSAAAGAAAPAGGATTSAVPAPSATNADARVTRADKSRILGDSTAKLWILVVSDFQCPFCGQWEKETSQAVIKEFVQTGIARMAFINFPLQQHPNALPAAEAAMCAGAQEKFWDMHGRIFERQSEWSNLADSPPFFEKIAGELGLDVDAYKACVKDHVMRPMILADAERATTAGARSTPTFFIGNQALAGAEKIEAFRSVIAKAQADLPK